MELVSDFRQLCHGISFSEHEPAPMLRLRQAANWRPRVSGTQSCAEPGNWRPQILPGLRHDEQGRFTQHLAVPKTKALRTGTQCDRCRRMDQTKFMHHFHKTGEAPEGLRKYLEQPHFLYIASFAHGVTKVGTTSRRANGADWPSRVRSLPAMLPVPLMVRQFEFLKIW